MIVAGSRSQVLASRIAKESGEKLACVEYKNFPDGERLVKVPEIKRSEKATIVASTPDDKSWIELLQLIDACSNFSKIDLIIPYMGYSRQDKRFEKGEAISARAVSKSVRNVDSVTTINLHEDSVLKWFDCNTQNLDASPVLASYFNSVSPAVLAPDEGAIELAEKFASEIGGDSDYLEKKRLSGDKIEIKPKFLDIENRDVIIIDDIISTGGTMSEAIEILKDQEASSVKIACVHPVFANNAILRLFSRGVENIVTTDTLETALSKISVASLILNSIKS